MTHEEMAEILEAITYKPGWHILVGFQHDQPYVQLHVTEESDATLDSCSRDGKRTPWRGSKRFLSTHMCRQEIVGAVFGLIQDAESHEMREWFRYRGASIYNPHLDPDALVPVARRKSSFVLRENAMTMEEA
ncbi:hypothetical protein [Mesorhizobium retamae]|uniref:Uncharacterized protein n=1 Tax=Mesorhizobium retamae TaxID=2912854 RepID=A0ABS9QI49_9HYPH|nr:hypothetical protein [Mesorhizobium sp. IRAMC:0171]MCG7507086.1 hypothetical protein [Mesorhizobium sp. IRAMC:0171]